MRTIKWKQNMTAFKLFVKNTSPFRLFQTRKISQKVRNLKGNRAAWGVRPRRLIPNEPYSCGNYGPAMPGSPPRTYKILVYNYHSCILI